MLEERSCRVRIARFARSGDISFGLVQGGGDDPSSLMIAPLHGHPLFDPTPTGDVLPLSEVRLLAPQEYAGLSIGDEANGRLAGPVRMARSGQRSGQRDEVAGTLVQRVVRAFPEAQVGTG